MINLKKQKKLLIGKGNERLCYIHPFEDTKVIKITYNKNKTREQNKIEYIYYQILKKRKTDFKYIPKLHNKINTDEGLGLMYENIVNYDGTPSVSLDEALRKKIICRDKALKLAEKLYLNFKKHGIVLGDVSMKNILYQKYTANSSKLVIVDGIGPRRNGIKFFFYIHSIKYSRYKVYKQFKILFKLIKNAQ
jgi:hypothetical protein